MSRKWFDFILIVTCLFTFSGAAAAQCGADGTQPCSGKPKASPATKSNKMKPPTRTIPGKVLTATKITRKKNAPAKKTPVSVVKKGNIVSASIDVTVNQSGSSIEIFQVDNGAESNISSHLTADSGETVSFDPLESGDYVVRVKKNGFYEETKRISLKGRKSINVNVELRPATGFLTVISHTEGTEVEIKGVGNFTKKVEDFALAPNKYEIYITKDGYETSVQIADVRLGQTTLVSATLQPVSFDKLLQNAENDFQANRYPETISKARLILEKNIDQTRANQLMGYSYFYTERPRESRFYLLRTLALQGEIELPVKIYQKEKNSETLSDGTLKIDRNNLSFSSAKRPELNFSVAPSAIISLLVNQEKNSSGNVSTSKPYSIEIKAMIASGKKTEKKNLRFFSRQTYARALAPNKSEIAGCTGCNAGRCPCQAEIQAVYELLLNWKTGSFPRQTSVYGAVTPPSKSFVQYSADYFSFNVPDNWQTVLQTKDDVWLAPNGGFLRSQNRTLFRYALNAGVRAISVNDLRTETENLYREKLSSSSYLDQQGEPKETFISGKRALVSSFAGFGVEDGEEEFVQIYTTFTSNGNLFYIITVTPFNERQKYKSVINQTLASIVLRAN